MVTVESAAPSAITGPVPEIFELPDVGRVDEKVTVVDPVTAIGEVSWRVFTSALVEESVHIDTPVASVAEQAP